MDEIYIMKIWIWFIRSLYALRLFTCQVEFKSLIFYGKD